MNALFTYDYGDEMMSKVKALGYNVQIVKEADVNNALLTTIQFEPEVLVCYDPFATLDISTLPQLKWIQLSSIGVNQVPVEAVMHQKIIVTNNRGGYSIPMGEWIVHQMLSFYKQEYYFYKKQELHHWRLNTEVRELTDKRVCFIGTGTIAKEAVKRLSGFEMTCIGINTSGHLVKGFDECYPMDALETILPTADFIVIAIPHTQATTHLINSKRIQLMKKDAVLINVARGAIIHEEALIEALDQDHFLGVALDVFEQEPLLENHPFWSYSQVKVTPHNSWISQMRNIRRFKLIYKNLEAYIQNRKLENVVDLIKGY